MTLTELCRELKNWFPRRIVKGKFKIKDGQLLDEIGLQENQFYKIDGSIFNDGIHRHIDNGMTDEEFCGEITLMAVPMDVIYLLDEINDWQAKYGSVVASPYLSESFGGYSYSKKSSGNSGNSSAAFGYKTVFADRLDRWRKV